MYFMVNFQRKWKLQKCFLLVDSQLCTSLVDYCVFCVEPWYSKVGLGHAKDLEVPVQRAIISILQINKLHI